MAYLDEIVTYNRGLQPQEAYASYFAPYEVQTPQYPFPNPYTLAQLGFRRNEIIYACVEKRSKAIAEASIVVKQNDETLDSHPLKQLIHAPITLPDGKVKLTEKSFWRATSTYLAIAGFAAWEIEFNNLGVPINLWPMRPDWCSFRRGTNNPLEFIRYQPYGLPYADIPASRVLLFQYFDPLYPLLKAIGPSQIANRVSTVDNGTTDFLQIFYQRGAVIQGVLSSDQTLQEAEVMRVKQRWADTVGGVSHWGEPLVMGQGLKYQPVQMNFREMQFDAIDGRNEARICLAFEIPPILVGTKVGIGASTYSNYEEARKAWYEEWVAPEWDWLDSELEGQLLPHFEPAQGTSYIVEFDLSNVKALQENEDAKHTRAREDVKAGILTKDEAREMIGYDPLEVEETPEPENTLPVQEQELEDAAKELERKQFKQYVKNHGNAEGFKFKHLSAQEQQTLLEAQPSETGKPFQVYRNQLQKFIV